MQPKRKDLVRPLHATRVTWKIKQTLARKSTWTKRISRKSLYERREKETLERKEEIAKVDETPSHAWYMMLVYIMFVHIAFRLVSGVARLCASTLVRSGTKGIGQVHGSQASTEDKYYSLILGAYVNAAYCGANPVSHPNPLPYPPCVADPHCWASTLGSGSAGIGAIAWGGL